MREPRKKKTHGDLDLTKPIDKTKLIQEDCFGKEWDMGSKDCPICHDNEVCGILFSDLVKKKSKQIQKGKPTFLDKAFFSKKLTTALDKALSDRGEVELEEVYDVVKLKANVSDRVAIREWVKRFANDNGYIIQGKEIWKV